MKSFYCLLVQGGHLDDGVRTALYLTACKMLKDSKGRLKFTDELAQGVVTTDGKVISLSSAVRGVSFDAVVDCKTGNSINCKFLMDRRNLIPEEEFYEGLVAWTRAQITFNEEEDEGEAWKREQTIDSKAPRDKPFTDFTSRGGFSFSKPNNTSH